MTISAVVIAAMLQAATVVASPSPDPAIARMAALYDAVCLQAFPIDGAVDSLMASRAMVESGATPLTPEQVKVTLVDNPGRGWRVKDGDRDMLVFLELPPFHACSVRRFLPTGRIDLGAYRPVADRFEADHPAFAPLEPHEVDRGELHEHGYGESRELSGGGAESLFVIDQHVIEPAKRAAGEAEVNLRFVHQIYAAP